VNISAHSIIIPVKFVEEAVYAPRGVVIIGKLKEEYFVLIVLNLLVLLVVDVLIISEVIMLLDTIIGFDQIHEKNHMRK
jgi:hypothetical protein